MDNRSIGVFDSGVGGLSVLEEVKKLLPQENFVFVADQKNVPYGGKTQTELENLVTKIADFLVKKDVKLILVACNTATVYTIDFLRAKYSLPIVGVVPVVKTLAQLTKSGKTAVFATPATTKSKYLQELITKFANEIKVYKIGGSGLEELIEQGDLENPAIKIRLEEHLRPLMEKGVDVVALGCTHYPFLRKQIQNLVGNKVTVIDSGGAVARQVKRVLSNNDALGNAREDDYYFTTGSVLDFKKATKNLLRRDFKNVAHLELL